MYMKYSKVSLDNFDKEKKIPPRSASETEYGKFQELLRQVLGSKKKERKPSYPGFNHL